MRYFEKSSVSDKTIEQSAKLSYDKIKKYTSKDMGDFMDVARMKKYIKALKQSNLFSSAVLERAFK